MLIEELSKYGDIRNQYVGRGRFRNSSNDCDFGVVQLSDSSIYLICEFTSMIDSSNLNLNREDTPTFIGTTDQGKLLTFDGNLLMRHSNISSSEPTKATFTTSGECHLAIGDKNFNEEIEIRFNITNFIFTGTQVEQVSETKRKLNALKLQLGEDKVLIRKLSNFDDMEGNLRAKKNIEVTSQIIFGDKFISGINDTIQMVYNICGLLTIANGTLISWISFEVYSSNGEQIYIEHQPNITDNFGATPLIDKMPPDAIELFLNTVYQSYTNLKSIYDLDSIGRLYSSIRLSGYIEVRSLSIASLVEFLLNKFAENQPDKQTLIDAKIFKKNRDELKREIKEAFKSIFPELEEDIHDEIQKKINEFNRISFNERLKRFVKYFCIPISDQEIADFIQNRNKLAHGLSFKTDDKAQEYQFMVHFFDRLLLGMLGYKGYYINFTRPNQWVGSQTDYFEPVC